MAHVIGYHRPSSLEEALSLLSAPGATKVVMAGGTSINAGTDFSPVEVVDLQSLGLGSIEIVGGRVVAGATATLDAFGASGHVPSPLADLARREAPSTLRAVGTIGGLIAEADPESELLAGLLVHDALVTVIDGSGTHEHQLSEVLAEGPGSGIITQVSFDPGGTTAAARTGRTPGDRPIVAAVARKTDAGEILVALCGVAATPILVDEIENLDPPADFRGSTAYRKRLAEVLTGRVHVEVS